MHKRMKTKKGYLLCCNICIILCVSFMMYSLYTAILCRFCIVVKVILFMVLYINVAEFYLLNSCIFD